MAGLSFTPNITSIRTVGVRDAAVDFNVAFHCCPQTILRSYLKLNPRESLNISVLCFLSRIIFVIRSSCTHIGYESSGKSFSVFLFSHIKERFRLMRVLYPYSLIGQVSDVWIKKKSVKSQMFESKQTTVSGVCWLHFPAAFSHSRLLFFEIWICRFILFYVMCVSLYDVLCCGLVCRITPSKSMLKTIYSVRSKLQRIKYEFAAAAMSILIRWDFANINSVFCEIELFPYSGIDFSSPLVLRDR